MTLPGQLGLLGEEAPADQPDGKLTAVGFAAVHQDGQVRYRDPFSSGPLLTHGQASLLLRERMRTVVSRGFRVHFPPGRQTSARIGQRRCSIEGARHEVYGFTGGHPHHEVYVVDDAGKRVWP